MLHMREQVINCDLASKINWLLQKISKHKLVTWVMAFVFICLFLDVSNRMVDLSSMCSWGKGEVCSRMGI